MKHFSLEVIYRHPNSDVKMFTELMDHRFEMLHRSKKQCIIAGGLNIDLSKFNVDKNCNDTTVTSGKFIC